MDGIRQQCLVLPRCEDCGRFHWYPLRRCPYCHSTLIAWPNVAPHGLVYTFTTVRHAFSQADHDRIPYVVALIELPDAPGVRLISEIVVRAGHPLRIGAPVSAVFESSGKEPRVLFTPSNSLPVATSLNSGDYA